MFPGLRLQLMCLLKVQPLWLIIKASCLTGRGRWETHEAFVCSGKLLNCCCVYTEDHAIEETQSVFLVCVWMYAQRIWSGQRQYKATQKKTQNQHKKKLQQTHTSHPGNAAANSLPVAPTPPLCSIKVR